METLQARREWHNIFKVRKRKIKNTLPSKALIQIWWTNQKLYRQAKANRIQHHKPASQQIIKELLQAEKKRLELETRKLRMGKLISKDKHTVKVEKHPHTNMISKLAIMRRGEYKFRILEGHLKLRNQQFKPILYIYRLQYQNLMLTTNQKSTIYMHTKKKKASKHNTKVSHQITREQKRKGRIKDLQKHIKNN